MFNLSGSELIFLVLIALVVLGPDKLPEAMRKAGKLYNDFKKMTNGFQDEMRSVLEEPLREMRETADLVKNSAMFDPSPFAAPGASPETSVPPIPMLAAEPEPEPEPAVVQTPKPHHSYELSFEERTALTTPADATEPAGISDHTDVGIADVSDHTDVVIEEVPPA